MLRKINLEMQGGNAWCLELQMKYQHAIKSLNLASTCKTNDNFESLSKYLRDGHRGI